MSLVERMDPRVAAFVAAMPPAATADVTNREELLAEAASEVGRAPLAAEAAFMESGDDEAVAPSAGLRLATYSVRQPAGHSIRLYLTRPDNETVLPCVYYVHGGAMAYLSCTYGNYRAWARLIAAHGVAVVMVDFRNCVAPSSVPEVAPYPAGLDDCVAGLEWVVDPRGRAQRGRERVVVSGESGGGNLTLALGMRLARERPRARGGSLRLLPLHRRRLAGRPLSLVERAGRAAQRRQDQPRPRRLRDRRLRGPRPARLAGLRDSRRRHRLAADGRERQRAGPASRRGRRLLPTPARRRGVGAGAESCSAPRMRSSSSPPSAPRSAAPPRRPGRLRPRQTGRHVDPGIAGRPIAPSPRTPRRRARPGRSRGPTSRDSQPPQGRPPD